MGEVWPDGTGVKTAAEVSKLCARIAELELENERLLLAVAEAQQQAKAHDAYAQELEKWQREACEVLTLYRLIDTANGTQPHAGIDRLLGEAGRGTDGAPS